MRIINLIFVAIIIISVSSCSRLYGEQSYIIDRDSTYLQAKSVPPLKIPPGYDSSTIHEQYPVSDRQYSINAKDVSITPPGLYH